MQWISYLATCSEAAAPAWLQADWILAQFGKQRASAIRKNGELLQGDPAVAPVTPVLR